MAVRGILNTDIFSDETFDLLCSVCKRKGKNCEAEKYCVECKEYYCLTCVKLHEVLSFLSSHKILDQGQFKTSKVLSASQQGSGKTLPAAPTEMCNIHNHYHIDMYCQNHDDVGCATCMGTDHRLCKDTFYIPEFLQNYTTMPTSKEIAQTLDEVAKILTKNQSDLRHEKQKLLKAKTDALENVRKFRKEINDRLNKLEQNSIYEIESLCKALSEEIEKATKEVQTNQSNINSAQHKLASPGNTVSQVFVNAKKGNKTAQLALKWIEGNKSQIPVVDIDFKADQRLSKLLEEINTLGNVIQSNVEKDEENTASSATKSLVQLISSREYIRQKQYPALSSSTQQKNVLLQGKRMKNYNVEVKSDKLHCDIISACALVDGTLILSDYNNNKLKCLDSSTYTVTDYCCLPCSPRQVCPISKQEVAVCLPRKCIVQFISVGRRMTKTREISTDFSCYGLAYANDNLYISDYTSVYIYSIAGSKQMQFNQDQSGQRLFSIIYSLAVSKDGSRIYVAVLKKGLIVLDNNGHFVKEFNDPQLNGAYSCYLTDTGSVVVCGQNSHNVLQFGPDGELIGEIVKSDENKAFRAVCCNRQMSNLIVGSYNSNEIEVYDLV